MTRNHPPGGTRKQDRLLYFGASRRQNDRFTHLHSRNPVLPRRHQSPAGDRGHAGYRFVREIVMFLRLLAIEIRKTLKNPGLWVGLAGVLFLLACATLFRHVQILHGYANSSGGLEKDLLSGLAIFNQIGILVYAILSVGIAAFEYVDSSIQLLLKH